MKILPLVANNASGYVNRRKSMLEVTLDLRTSVKVIKYKAKGLKVMVE
jgi:hypothetical protein